MQESLLKQKEVRAYTVLTSLVICGLAASLITAPKIVHAGVNFPFSNIVFSIFTYPIIDCICELWGQQTARQTMWIGTCSQMLLMIIIQLSILVPHADFWQLQTAYQSVLGTGAKIVIASLLAFTTSQILDIVIYQRIKEACKGKLLWLRSNISTYMGQMVDSGIFVSIVFYASNQKLNILAGSILVKIILSLLMTPMVYLIVIGVNRYLDSNTLAFKNESEINPDLLAQTRIATS